MHLYKALTPDPQSESDETRASLEAEDAVAEQLTLSLRVRMRGTPGVLGEDGFGCSGTDEPVYCGIECDGGGFRLKRSGGALLLENDRIIVNGAGCGSGERKPVAIPTGGDDSLFRLEPRPMSACLAERDAGRPVWAASAPPLRLALAGAAGLCHARRYDDAHLRAHPQQNVAEAWLLQAPGEPMKEGEVTLALGFRFRDGTTTGRRLDCLAADFALECYDGEGGPIDATPIHLRREGPNAVRIDDFGGGTLAAILGGPFGSDDRAFQLDRVGIDACADPAVAGRR
jgi:hypothetical protein